VQYVQALLERAHDEILYKGLQGVLYMRLQTYVLCESLCMLMHLHVCLSARLLRSAIIRDLFKN
jgi:hypothetical protein